MSQKTTLRTLHSESFQVAIRQDDLTGKVSVAILPSEGKQWAQLTLWTFECHGAREAAELCQLLKSAAAMASHLEEGGVVETWRL